MARAERDAQPVITKTLKEAAQNPSAIARYRHEFDLNQSLTSPFVCQAMAFDDQLKQIVFEDNGGESLRTLLTNSALGFNEKLHIARQLALAKGEVKNLFGLAQSFEIALAEVLESAEALASREIPFRASDFNA